MYSTSDFRNGLKIEFDGYPWMITYFQAVNPGKGSAFTRTKLKNMITGAVLERTFKNVEKVKKPDLEEHKMQYLYKDDSGYVFMNMESYEQDSVSEDNIGDDLLLLTENIEVDVLYFNGRPIGLTFPNHMVLTIVECEPGIKGDTATGAVKPATLDTGLVVTVPLFVNQGEKIRIDTRKKEYLERVK